MLLYRWVRLIPRRLLNRSSPGMKGTSFPRNAKAKAKKTHRITAEKPSEKSSAFWIKQSILRSKDVNVVLSKGREPPLRKT